MLKNKNTDLCFTRFLGSTLTIPNRFIVEFFTFPSFTNGVNPSERIKHILQNEVYDCVKVKAFMNIRFSLFYKLDRVPEQPRFEDVFPNYYEEEQLEDLHDEGDEDITVETPFSLDDCSICLTAKPDILLFPCLHKSYCSECEKRGIIEKCPTCRKTITKKVKI